MIKVIDAQTNAEIGEITQAQLDFLTSQLEEESDADTDYYINSDTLDYFAQQGADPALILLLRTALGSRLDMDIRWIIA
jgi:processive 1,2-diacylglycerol beta-glucosyltransferase